MTMKDDLLIGFRGFKFEDGLLSCGRCYGCGSYIEVEAAPKDKHCSPCPICREKQPFVNPEDPAPIKRMKAEFESLLYPGGSKSTIKRIVTFIPDLVSGWKKSFYRTVKPKGFVSALFSTWRCDWSRGLPICCMAWGSMFWNPIFGYKWKPGSVMYRFVDWYLKSHGVYMYYQGRVEPCGYSLCPICLFLKRIKEIKDCGYDEEGACRDRDCREWRAGQRAKLEEQRKRGGIVLRAGYSYNPRTGEHKKLPEVEKQPVWPWNWI